MQKKFSTRLSGAILSALFLLLSSQAQGQEPVAAAAEDQKVLDKQIQDALRRIINAGADLYNRDGDRAGCYRLYQGSLLTLRPFLERHPKLQQGVDKALAAADQESNMGQRAHLLREALGKVRDGLKSGESGTNTADTANATPGTNSSAPTEGGPLWNRLGGEAKVRKVVDDFVAAAAKDAKVNFSRGKNLDDAAVSKLKKGLVDFISQATGGPFKYTGKSMREVHKGMLITNAEFDALAVDLKQALQKNGASEADTAAVLKLVEGTRKDVVEPK